MATRIALSDLAWAAAWDAGNRRMRSEGRTAWTREDYLAAAQEYDRLIEEAVKITCATFPKGDH